MERAELVQGIKELCEANKLKLVDDIAIGHSILIIVRGEKCKDLLEEHLSSLGLEHTEPVLIADGIGSYVTL